MEGGRCPGLVWGRAVGPELRQGRSSGHGIENTPLSRATGFARGLSLAASVVAVLALSASAETAKEDHIRVHPRSSAVHSPAPETAREEHRSITLEQAYDMTLATDQSIRSAWHEIRKANLQPWSALTRMGPSLTGNGSIDSSRNARSSYSSVTTNADGSSNVTTTLTDTSYAGFTFQQPLLDFSVFPAYRLGKLTARAARLQQQFTVRQTLFGVAQAYYNVLKQQSLVGVNQEAVELAQKQLDLAQTRLNVGAVARIDVMRARATLEDARNTLIQSKGLLETNRDTLSNILNLGGVTHFVLVEPEGAPEDRPAFEEVLTRAYDTREDLKVSELAIDQDVARRNQVRAQYAPRIVAQASTQWTDASGISSSRTHTNDAYVSVQMPFLTGGQREIDLLTASHQIEQTRLTYEKTRKTVESEVKNAWLKVGTVRESIQALSAEVEAATQNHADVQAQYEAGTATSLDVQSALRDLNNSRTLLTSQVYDFQVALRDLQRACASFQRGRVEKAKVK